MIREFRAGFFADPDLGSITDDLAGADTTRHMAFVYNRSPIDRVYGIPPALGFNLLGGAETIGYIRKGTFGPVVDPVRVDAYYARLQGRWNDGTPMRALNDGYDEPETAPITVTMFPGDPVTGAFWSMDNTNGAGGTYQGDDVREHIAAAPVDLAPGAAATLDLAILFARGRDRLDSITELRGVSDRVQAAYDTGTLSGLGRNPTRLPAPALAAPTDGANAARADSVRFRWEPVAGAHGYTLQWGPAPDRITNSQRTTATSLSIPLNRLAVHEGTETVFWRVTASGSGAIGVDSPVRSVVAFRGGPLRLADGSPAFVEVSGPGGADPCSATAASRDGCEEVGGNLVWKSFNSTEEYYLSESSSGVETSLAPFAPHDFEIRFTERGGLAAYFFASPFNVVRVPFEVWDVGLTPPGQPNDPSDDRRLIPALRSKTAGGSCAFDADDTPDGQTTRPGFVESDDIYGYYPSTNYADFEAAYAERVDAAPGACLALGSQSPLTQAVTGERPIQRLVFGSAASTPVLPRMGTVIRLYTIDPQPVTRAQAPQAERLAVSVAPNPAVGAATVRYVLTAPATVRVALADVLGREVAVLADGERPAGPQTVRLPAGLAAGVYVVTVTASGRRTSRLVTVAR